MSEAILGKLVVELDFDGTRFERGLSGAKRELSSYGKVVETSTKWAKDSNFAMEATNVALNNMKAQYQALNATKNQHLEIMRQEEQNGKRDSASYAKNARQVSVLNNEMYRLNQEYIAMQKQALIANSSFTKWGNAVSTVGDRMIGFGQGMSTVGDTLTRTGAIATAAGALFVKQAMDFETGLVGVQKTTNASAEQMKVFEQEIRNLATTMPIAHGELTNLAAVAGQLGVAQDDIANFTRIMAMMGTATNLSATEASEALARFTNITGTGTANIENLGSAIVALGNNFATSEREIVDMSMQLVGTLSSMGVAESEILGISTAMSSLGISAERGGSSVSKFFVQMQTAVTDGGVALENFANVAGKTPEIFANLVKTDPTQAFVAFVDGLAKINAEGGSVVQVLDDMGIKEVRLRDTLLRLAQGSEVLTSALNLSNEEFAKGTALMDEYNLMAGTTANQWQIVKNKLNDVAISIGQGLLPAITEVLDSSGGLIDMAEGFSDWFGGLSDGTKELVVQLGVLMPLAGTVLKVLGGLIDGGGKVLKLGGSILKGLGQMSGAIKALSLGDITSETVLLTNALGGLSVGVAGTVAALGVLAVAGGLAVRSWAEAHQAVQDFPDVAGITLEQAESMRKTFEAFDEVKIALSDLSSASTEYAEEVSRAIKQISDEIERLNSDKINEMQETYKNLPPQVRAMYEELAQQEIANGERRTTRAQEVEDKINQIYRTANAEKRELTNAEVQHARQLSDELILLYSNSLGASQEQSKQIYQTMTADLTNMSQEQIRIHANNVVEAFKGMGEGLEANKQAIINTLGNTEEAQVLITQLENVYAQSREKMTQEMVLTMAQMKHLQGQTLDETARNISEALATWTNGEINLLPEQIKAIMTGATEAMETGVQNMLTPLKGASEEATSAINKYNDALIDFANKAGVAVEDLSPEKIQEFMGSLQDLGFTWEDLEFLTKEANIDDNTRAFLEAVMEGWNMWKDLTFEEKVAKLEAEGVEGLKDMISHLDMWNALTPEQQQAIIQTIEEGGRLSDKLSELGLWNSLTLQEKLAIITTEGHDSLLGLLEEYRVFEHIPDEATKQAIVDAIANGTLDVETFINTWQGTEFATKTAEINATADPANVVGTFLAFWALSVLGLQDKTSTINVDDQATSPTNEAIGTVNEFDALEPNVPLEATDNASEEVSKVQRDVDKLGNSKPNTTLAATDNASGTIKNVQTSADQLGASKPTPTLSAYDGASGTISNVRQNLYYLDGTRADTYVYTHYVSTGQRAYSGTNRHVGGPLILGDGGRKEPYLTPQGHFGVSNDYDTVYDLPVGTKVWPSINRFKAEASSIPLLANYLDKLPKFATGTKHSFLDDLNTIKLPIKIEDFGKVDNQSSGETLNFNINLSVVGDSISPSQADKIIEPIIRSAERYSKRKRTNVAIGGV